MVEQAIVFGQATTVILTATAQPTGPAAPIPSTAMTSPALSRINGVRVIDSSF